MNGSPSYFEPIRQRASQRWEQLENDPELAGPWHQLFKQVQSPRHILSELLQNADDAGATEASVCIEDGAFIFTHNGDDFTEEHFASICRFGYSNKRALHTIGFRGIGFKSTFSLGNCVELITPTLSVNFHQDRFTEPKWAISDVESNNRTIVRVAISDDHRRVEVEKNLQDWLKSPVSLLFFKSIRRIQIGESEVHWGSLGPGPVTDTEWLALHDNDDESFLIARSSPEPFPEDALNEIRQERMLNAEEDTGFPDCIVEIVVGFDGQLFVVLPTGVKTALPFACNAPFVQDPARLKIKAPETSPTNRWLLQRAGKLAAQVMLDWLGQSGVNPLEKASAYDLMPDVDHDDSSLEGVCGTIVEKAFAEVIKDQEYLLTEEGKLTRSKESIIIPNAILDVWPNTQASALLDDDGRPALSHYVSPSSRKKLLNSGEIEEINIAGVLNALQKKHLPKPKSWRHLLGLWTYLAPVIAVYLYHGRVEGLYIVPVQSKEVLCSADEVVRLGEKKMLPSDEDWQFLGDRLSVLDQNWLRYLTGQRRVAETSEDKELSERVEAAYAVLEAISLDNPSDTGRVIDQVAAEFFGQKEVTLANAIRIAQIAAKLGAGAGDAFRFACQDRRLRPVSNTILFDSDGSLDLLLPDEWSEAHLLHPDYLKTYTSCTREEWHRWVSSGQSGLHTFIPLQQVRKNFHSKSRINDVARQRGYQGELSYHYVTSHFIVEDWDFNDTFWSFWQSLEDDVDQVWVKVAEQILSQRDGFWKNSKSARLLHVATTGNTRSMTNEPVLPSWILRMREKECLRDIHGVGRKPEELLRRTSETEALMDIEPFVHGLLDNEPSRPLLSLLGVGDIPTGPDKLLSRLQTLAGNDNVPAHEVDKWYRRLDQLLEGCSTQDFSTVKTAFKNGKIVLTEKGTWENISGVFLASDEDDAPDAETVRSSVRELTLWRKIGVAERPTIELAIDWLLGVPCGDALSQEDARRVRSLQKRHADRVWIECKHWINLAGEWSRVEDLCYALTLQPLIPWAHFHKWVKQKTADFRQLPQDVSSAYPFSEIPLLAEHVNDLFHQNPLFGKKPEKRPWLNQLGTELSRINLDDEGEVDRIRNLGNNLSISAWQTTPSLEIISYINGTPAGTPRRADAIWLDNILYAEDRPVAKLARAVSQELDRFFRRPDISDAIKHCFERPPEYITEYMEENFTLIPCENMATQEPVKDPTEDAELESDDFGQQEANANIDLEVEGAIADTDISSSKQGAECDQSKDNEEIDGQGDAENEGDQTPELVLKSKQSPKPAKPSVIERLALKQGFNKDTDSRYFHKDGRWIGKTSASSFPWEQRSISGEIICHYWPKEHCLEREPIQLEADIWGLFEKHPDSYSLVLLTTEGDPVEVTGTRLSAMKDTGEIVLYPSTYRIVYEHDKQV